MDELQNFNFALSYPSLTRNIRARNLRPACQSCKSVLQRPTSSTSTLPVKKPNGIFSSCPIRPPDEA